MYTIMTPLPSLLTYVRAFSYRHIALAFAAASEEPMDIEDNSQLIDDDDYDVRGLCAVTSPVCSAWHPSA